MTSALWAVVVLVAWVALPGLAVATYVAREDGPVPAVRVLTAGLATGLSVWFLGSELLARFEVLSTPGAVIATLGIGLASLLLVLGPGRPGLRRLLQAPLLIEVGVMLLAAVVTALPFIVMVLDRRDSLSGPTPWYYLDLARAVVGTHGLPSHSIEWVSRIPFLDDYPGFTSATALLLSVGGAKSMVAAQVVRLVTLLAVGASAYLFARAVGAARSAAAVTVVVLFVGTTYAGKLGSYRPEATAYALVFLVAALAKLWMDERRNVDLVLGAVTLLALSEVHGIGWLFAALIVGGFAVAGVLFSEARRSAFRAAVLMIVVLIGGWLVGNLALGGGLSGANKISGLPTDGATDPTWRFTDLVAGRTGAQARPRLSTVDVARRGLNRGFVSLNAWWYLAAAAVVLLLLLFIAWHGRAEIRKAAREYTVMALLVVVACVAISMYFALRWSTYVPLRTGWGRLFPLTYSLLPAAIAVVVSAVPGPKLRAVAAAAVLVASGAVMVHGEDFFDQIERQQPTVAALESLRALHLSRDDRVLTNTYSEGFVGAVLDAQGVLDGRAPYSEPKTLKRASTLLDESIKFFANPLITPLPPAAEPIDYLLVATTPSVFGTPLIFYTNYESLAARADLELVREGPGWRLYKVNPPAS